MPDISRTLGGFDIEHWGPETQQQPEGTMSKIKYGLVNDGNLCHKTGDKEGVVFCHKNHIDRCGCACAAFQITEDKDGKKVAVLHCFPEPREIDVEFEIQEDTTMRVEREHRERLLRMVTTGPISPGETVGQMMRPGGMAPRDTGLPTRHHPGEAIPPQRPDPDVMRDLDGDDNPQTEGNNGGG